MSSVPWGPGRLSQEQGKSQGRLSRTGEGVPTVGGPTHAPFTSKLCLQDRDPGSSRPLGSSWRHRDAGVSKAAGAGTGSPARLRLPAPRLPASPRAQRKTSAGSVPAPGSDSGAASGARDKGWARSSERQVGGHKAARDWCQMKVTESWSLKQACRESISWPRTVKQSPGRGALPARGQTRPAGTPGAQPGPHADPAEQPGGRRARGHERVSGEGGARQGDLGAARHVTQRASRPRSSAPRVGRPGPGAAPRSAGWRPRGRLRTGC